jgi:DNA-binding Lrp family transcriptional regulator
MKTLTARLLNDFQRDFPLRSMPFAQIARQLDTSSDVVLRELKALKEEGAVSRVGPVFRPNTVGASTLATMSVPAHRLEAVATAINEFPQVNHNYEREHTYNLWFVLTAENDRRLQQTLIKIQRQTGFRVLSLPLLRDYHIDLGFRMQLSAQDEIVPADDSSSDAKSIRQRECLYGSAEDLIEVIQAGLPLVPRPYQEVATRLGCSEQTVIRRLQEMIDVGIIKRLGVVVRHHELGYSANAMVVWDVADDQVDALGSQLGQQDCVTLCYQRPRRLPDWPYNLFCMVHGRHRQEVLHCIDQMTQGLGLEHVPHAVLFSGRRFRQRGALYRGCH